jgi:hypothetical protein
MRKDQRIIEKFKLKTAVWKSGKLTVEELTFDNFNSAYQFSKKIKGYTKIYNHLEEIVTSHNSPETSDSTEDSYS